MMYRDSTWLAGCPIRPSDVWVQAAAGQAQSPANRPVSVATRRWFLPLLTWLGCGKGLRPPWVVYKSKNRVCQYRPKHALLSRKDRTCGAPRTREMQKPVSASISTFKSSALRTHRSGFCSRVRSSHLPGRSPYELRIYGTKLNWNIWSTYLLFDDPRAEVLGFDRLMSVILLSHIFLSFVSISILPAS